MNNKIWKVQIGTSASLANDTVMFTAKNILEAVTKADKYLKKHLKDYLYPVQVISCVMVGRVEQ